MTCRNICCRSSNVIYCIRCQACGNNYVGQMKRRLVRRMHEYYHNVQQLCTTHIIGKHYNSTRHTGIPDTRVFILECIKAPPDSQSAKQQGYLRKKTNLSSMIDDPDGTKCNGLNPVHLQIYICDINRYPHHTKVT